MSGKDVMSPSGPVDDQSTCDLLRHLRSGLEQCGMPVADVSRAFGSGLCHDTAGNGCKEDRDKDEIANKEARKENKFDMLENLFDKPRLADKDNPDLNRKHLEKAVSTFITKAHRDEPSHGTMTGLTSPTSRRSR